MPESECAQRCTTYQRYLNCELGDSVQQSYADEQERIDESTVPEPTKDLREQCALEDFNEAAVALERMSTHAEQGKCKPSRILGTCKNPYARIIIRSARVNF